MNIEIRFSEAISAAGITPPSEVMADGELHRFHIDGDKHGSQNGWYVLYPGNLSYGLCGDWKTGLITKWYGRDRSKLTTHEQIQLRNHMQNVKRQQEWDRKQAYLTAAELATQRWQSYKAATAKHPYLVRKQIHSYCARQINNFLVLPIIDYYEKLWSLQYISPSGTKMLLSGSSKRGHFILVQGQPTYSNRTLICEGFATAASLAVTYPKACVIAAIDAGNLEAVALSIRQHQPRAEIVICADDDRNKTENVGLVKARRAAIAAGAFLAKPQWPKNAPLDLTDFNDLACWLAIKEIVV